MESYVGIQKLSGQLRGPEIVFSYQRISQMAVRSSLEKEAQLFL